MQAKISYSVDFTEVPKEVNKLLADPLHSLVNLSKQNLRCSKHNILEVAEKIDEMRRSLLQIDNRLQECYSILVAYNKALYEDATPTEEVINDGAEQSLPE